MAISARRGTARSSRAAIWPRVIARAGRDEIAGERDGRLLIRLTAPPVEGAANAALCRLVARCAGVPARRVSIVRGQTSRDKVIRVEGKTAGELRALMTAQLAIACSLTSSLSSHLAGLPAPPAGRLQTLAADEGEHRAWHGHRSLRFARSDSAAPTAPTARRR